MSSPYEDQKEAEQRTWIEKWVPENDPALISCPDSFRYQYSFVLAKLRSAEAELTTYRNGLKAFHDLVRRAAP